MYKLAYYGESDEYLDDWHEVLIVSDKNKRLRIFIFVYTVL